MKRIILGIFMSTFLVNTISAQNYSKAQKELIGSTIEKIEFTDYVKNIPEDKEFDNKFKILEFWTTWCKPCLRAVPHLNRLRSKFKDEDDLVFLSITYESPEKIRKVLKKVRFKTIVVSDQTMKIHKDLNIFYNGMMIFPQTVLIDNSNKIIWYGKPSELNAKIIRKFLNKENI